MNEDEDLELLALQRQLDDAFQTTRPRPAFEDELWSRMQAHRPIWVRIRFGLTGLLKSMRESPAVPSAAVAVALIVVLGAGIYTLSGLHPSGGSTASGAVKGNDSAVVPQSDFGRLPRPAALSELQGGPATTPSTVFGGAYAGPATLVWAGDLRVSASALPVYRYSEPSRNEADRFATSLGAVPVPDVAQGGIGVYGGRNFTLVVLASVEQPAREPYVNVSDLKSTVSSTGDSVKVATAYLKAHHLVPTWPFQTEVQTIGTTVQVTFLRAFDVQGLGQASLIDGAGNRYGTEVDFAPGTTAAFEKAPMPLTFEPGTYPIISADQAIRSMGAASAPSSASTPVVRMTKAELVYTLVWGGEHSYYEPAYLFSGTFSDRGVQKVMRVLVPAVVPSLLSP
ncbi:MAG: hypothetical protein ABI959_01295 [Candidatus Dormiibacterota bacterium]